MKLIPLTRGLFAQVDDEDYEYLRQRRWHIFKTCNLYYAQGYDKVVNGKETNVFMHRVLMKAEKGQLVDHRDRNGLNNQKSNLRFCSHDQNMKNRKSSSITGYLGVTIDRGKYYLARICVNGLPRHVGSFKTAEEAARAYDKVAKAHHGEFANLNFK